MDVHGLWKWRDVIISSPSEIRRQVNGMNVYKSEVLTPKNIRDSLVIRPLGIETGNARTVSQATVSWQQTPWASPASGFFAADYGKHVDFERQR